MSPELAGLYTIGQAHAALGRLAGGRALVFAAALLASGLQFCPS